MIHKRGKVTVQGITFRFNMEAIGEMIERFPEVWEVIGQFTGKGGRTNERKFFQVLAFCAQDKYSELEEFRDEVLDELSLAEFAELKSTTSVALNDLVKKNMQDAQEVESSTSESSTVQQSALPE